MSRESPITFEVFTAATRDFFKAWKPVTGYVAWFTVLNLAVLAPLSAWVLEGIIRSNGQVVVMNHDLVAFALSVRGVVFMLATAAIYLVVFMIEVGGLTLLAAQLHNRQPASLWDAIRTCATRVPAFVRLSVIQASLVLGVAAVTALALAGIKAGFLGGHDINFYLSEKPPEWWRAVAVGGVTASVCGCVLLWIVVRWIFAVPTLLLTNTGARTALRRSWQSSSGRALRISVALTAWWGGTTLVWSLAAFLGRLLMNPLFAWAGLTPARILPLVALSAVVATVGALVWSIITLGIHQFVVTRLAIRLCELSDAHLSNLTTREPHPPAPQRSRRLTQAAWGLAVGVAIASTLTGWTMVRNLNLVETVEITAHRGSSADAPENTLAAFRQAIAEGADYIELDVQTSADGEVIVLHDRDFMRVAGDPRRVEDLTLDEIRQIDVGQQFAATFAGEHAPTLAEVIELVNGRVRLNIELKYNRHDPTLVPTVLAVLRQTGFLEQCVITSLNAAAVSDVRSAASKARTGLIVTASVGNVARFDADFLSVAADRATARAIRGMHRADKEVHVWTVNDPLAMLHMIENGADNIITDKPAVLKTVLDERAKLSDPEKVALRLRVLFGGGIPVQSEGSSQQ